MKYLKISNNGIMDEMSLTLLGASSKREDHKKIGMFGSGNKYALAYFLRNNYEICIYAGKDEIKLSTVERQHRGKTFNVIIINGKETGITTDFGKDWEFWQAVREVYCNAIDEGEHKMEYVMNIAPDENQTHFYIRTRSEVTNFVQNFDNYFAENKKVVFECELGRIVEKSENPILNLYRKGIRCFETDRKSVYDYDLNAVDIDENRIAKYSWQIPSHIWNLIYQCTDKTVIKNILFQCHDSGFVECLSADFASVYEGNMSKEYIEVLNELQVAPREMSGLLSIEEQGSTTILPRILFDQAKAVVKNSNLPTKFKCYKDHFFVDIELTDLHQATLKKANEFFKECEYEIPYPIKAARFEEKAIYGLADVDNQEIILSENCLDKGVQMVIETIIEEFIHLKHQVKDETRGFQNAAITEIVRLLKIHHAFLL